MPAQAKHVTDYPEVCLRYKAMVAISRDIMVVESGGERVRRIDKHEDADPGQYKIGWWSYPIKGTRTNKPVMLWHPDELAKARNTGTINITHDTQLNRILATYRYSQFMQRVDEQMHRWQETLAEEWIQCLRGP